MQGSGRQRVEGLPEQLAADQVLGSHWEQEAYDVVDAVWLKDERIREIVDDAV